VHGERKGGKSQRQRAESVGWASPRRYRKKGNEISLLEIIKLANRTPGIKGSNNFKEKRKKIFRGSKSLLLRRGTCKGIHFHARGRRMSGNRELFELGADLVKVER